MTSFLKLEKSSRTVGVSRTPFACFSHIFRISSFRALAASAAFRAAMQLHRRKHFFAAPVCPDQLSSEARVNTAADHRNFHPAHPGFCSAESHFVFVNGLSAELFQRKRAAAGRDPRRRVLFFIFRGSDPSSAAFRRFPASPVQTARRSIPAGGCGIRASA